MNFEDQYTIQLKPGMEEKWRQHAAVNSMDGYSMSCVWFALLWAVEMQNRMAKDGLMLLTKEIADETGHDINKGMGIWGMTGAQYGMAKSVLEQAWIHGDTLAKFKL